MKIFKSNTEIIKTKIDKETVLKKMKQNGAFVINDSFGYIGIISGINGYVETEENITKIHITSELNGGLKLFGIFWFIGTFFGFIYGIYKIINERSFDWLPIVSLALLIFGFLIIILISNDQSESIKSEIKSTFKRI